LLPLVTATILWTALGPLKPFNGSVDSIGRVPVDS
jgi:hypothetical protein